MSERRRAERRRTRKYARTSCGEGDETDRKNRSNRELERTRDQSFDQEDQSSEAASRNEKRAIRFSNETLFSEREKEQSRQRHPEMRKDQGSRDFFRNSRDSSHSRFSKLSQDGMFTTYPVPSLITLLRPREKKSAREKEGMRGRREEQRVGKNNPPTRSWLEGAVGTSNQLQYAIADPDKTALLIPASQTKRARDW